MRRDKDPRELRDFPPALLAAMEAIRDDREHGASWLARRAAQAVVDAALLDRGDPERRLAALRTALRSISRLRPSMAALANTAGRIWSDAATSAPDDDPAARVSAVAQSARHVLSGWDEAARAIAAHAAPLLGAVVCTHSRSGTVEAVLRDNAMDPRSGKPRRLVIGEGRPGGEGLALARVLAQAGWSVLLVSDAAYGEFLGDTDVVVLGADSVRADGSLVNKVGSHPLALLAREAGLPVYVLCEMLKIAPPDFPLRLEEMDPRELLPEPVAGVTAVNLYFDSTPASLITGIVTERGMLKPPAIAPIAEEAERALALLRGL